MRVSSNDFNWHFLVQSSSVVRYWDSSLQVKWIYIHSRSKIMIFVHAEVCLCSYGAASRAYISLDDKVEIHMGLLVNFFERFISILWWADMLSMFKLTHHAFLIMNLSSFQTGDTLGKLLALISLSPLAIAVCMFTLILFRRDLHTVRSMLHKKSHTWYRHYVKS